MIKKKISDIFDIETGSTPSTSVLEYWENGTIKWITPKDLGELNSHYISKTERNITKLSLIKSSASPVPANSIIISTRAPIGYIAILTESMAFNQGCKALITKKQNEISSLYFYYQLLTKIDEMNHLGSGSTFKEISKEKLGNIKVLCPPLPVQQKIAAILEKADAARDKRRQANDLTEQFLQSSFIAMFGDPVRNEKGWEKSNLDEVCDINPRFKNDEKFNNSFQVSFIPMAAVDEKEGKIAIYSERNLLEVRKGYTYFADGDVLFAKITPCMENGKVAIAKNLKNGIGFGTTEFHVIRANEKILPEYIYSFLRRKTIRDDAVRHMTGTAGQQRVPTDYLKRLEIPIPPLSLQRQFAELVARVERLRAKQRECAKELDNLFGSLMQRAFKGALTVEN